MIRFLSRLWAGARTSPRPSTRPLKAEVAALESRTLQTFVITALHAQPEFIYPPNGRFVEVQVTGKAIEYHFNGRKAIFEDMPGPKQGNFQVTDEFAQIEPQGPVTPIHTTDNNFVFSFTTELQAKASKTYARGRRYYISVGLKDTDGWGGKTVAVWVPNSLTAKFIAANQENLAPAKPLPASNG